MLSFKITPGGSSSGLILTTEAMTRLGVKKGDTLSLTETPGWRLSTRALRSHICAPDGTRRRHHVRQPRGTASLGEMSGNDPGPWPWVQRNIVLVIHDRQLAEHGGSDGIRAPEAIESAVSTVTSWTRYGPWRAAGG